MVDRGYVEIVLTGVHIGDYGLDLPGGRRRLVDLIEAILRCPGLERFRLSSIEPGSIRPELIELLAAEDKFARHLHIPLQSGSNRVLARMRRRYAVESFRDLTAAISERVPDCGIGTDVICGFPSESEEDFRETFDWLLRLPVTYVHPFTYSVRPGSEAERYGDQVPGDVKKRRTRSLKRLSSDKNREFRERHVGRIVQVLVEGQRAGRSSKLAGWTDNYLRVSLGEGEPGTVMETVRITSNSDEGLVGTRLDRVEALAV